MKAAEIATLKKQIVGWCKSHSDSTPDEMEEFLGSLQGQPDLVSSIMVLILHTKNGHKPIPATKSELEAINEHLPMLAKYFTAKQESQVPVQ